MMVSLFVVVALLGVGCAKERAAKRRAHPPAAERRVTARSAREVAQLFVKNIEAGKYDEALQLCRFSNEYPRAWWLSAFKVWRQGWRVNPSYIDDQSSDWTLRVRNWNQGRISKEGPVVMAAIGGLRPGFEPSTLGFIMRRISGEWKIIGLVKGIA